MNSIDPEKILTLDELASIENMAEHFSRMESHYMFARFRGNPVSFQTLSRPLRLDCMTIMLCRRGSFDIELNLQNYHVSPNTLLVINPHTLIKTGGESHQTHMDLYVFFVSREFLVDINIDLNAINIRSLIENRSPAVSITEKESLKLGKFLDLLDINAREPETTIFSVNVARSLCAAIFYQLLNINFLRINRRDDGAEKSLGRRANYVHDFMRLVHLHHTRERSVNFYASQLFISPKYLTLLVKEATGRSAASWINEFVIIEAKNLLRFSGKNVQQVAYALNFSNQSSFGKYFKHLTGVSPTAYQKS